MELQPQHLRVEDLHLEQESKAQTMDALLEFNLQQEMVTLVTFVSKLASCSSLVEIDTTCHLTTFM